MSTFPNLAKIKPLLDKATYALDSHTRGVPNIFADLYSSNECKAWQALKEIAAGLLLCHSLKLSQDTFPVTDEEIKDFLIQYLPDEYLKELETLLFLSDSSDEDSMKVNDAFSGKEFLSDGLHYFNHNKFLGLQLIYFLHPEATGTKRERKLLQEVFQARGLEPSKGLFEEIELSYK